MIHCIGVSLRFFWRNHPTFTCVWGCLNLLPQKIRCLRADDFSLYLLKTNACSAELSVHMHGKGGLQTAIEDDPQ